MLSLCLPEDADARDGAPPGVLTVPHLSAALEGVSAGPLTFDTNLNVLFASGRLAQILAIPPAIALSARDVLTLLEGSAILDDAAVQVIHETCTAAAAAPQDPRAALTVTASPRDADVAGAPDAGARKFAVQIVGLADGTFMALFEEVTARHAAEADAIERAMLDPLTQLPNRQLFKSRAVALLAEWERAPARSTVVVMLVDLDRFKVVNDTLGHPVGDALLKLVGKRLRAMLRPKDLICRLGGDEFALVLYPGPDRDDTGALARRIVDVLSRPYLVDGHLVTIGASIGVAVAPGDGTEPDALLRHADLALYASKAAGRNTFSFFDHSMNARALDRRALEFDLRKALAMREFELFYQPQVDVERDAIVGFEALLRWRNPERGLVSPGDFIPLAEEIGLIGALGEWVIREACREATRWPGTLSVAVNVSPHQFEHPDRLIEVVGQALAASGLDGARLEIEITEGVLLRNEASVLAALHRLRAMGVRVAMDDFGTGYSSLSQLQSFPFDKIKIDRSFVRDGGDTAGQNAIIRAITALGVSLGMATIAEGVETADQLSRIRAEGCTSVQGYLFSRPVPVAEIDAFIAGFTERPSNPNSSKGQP